MKAMVNNNSHWETFNKYIDAEWKPILETPPFPEHTSAHSVASRGASLILTNLFGDNFAFIDSTEIPFGFKSYLIDCANDLKAALVGP